MYLDKVLAHSSQSWWNCLSDKSSGSIYTRILRTCTFCIFGFCQNFHLQLAESEDMEGLLCSWYVLLKGPENLWILVSLGAPETSLPPPPAQPCLVSCLQVLTHLRVQAKRSSCYS